MEKRCEVELAPYEDKALITYIAEYEDDEFEVFCATTDDLALDCAREFEDSHGLLFNIFELDDDYTKGRTVF